jgi:hypothetical protein
VEITHSTHTWGNLNGNHQVAKVFPCESVGMDGLQKDTSEYLHPTDPLGEVKPSQDRSTQYMKPSVAAAVALLLVKSRRVTPAHVAAGP